MRLANRRPFLSESCERRITVGIGLGISSFIAGVISLAN
jgi:hypothetical protein